MGGKVAKIDFFRVGIHAKNGHLSTDKVTKFSDKWFVLKKTSTWSVSSPQSATTSSLSKSPWSLFLER